MQSSWATQQLPYMRATANPSTTTTSSRIRMSANRRSSTRSRQVTAGRLQCACRSRPLETIRVEVAPGQFVTAPTAEESLRVKAYLVVQRNQVRDYLDVVALSERIGRDAAVGVLQRIDEFSDDRSLHNGSVLTSLALSLAAPRPRDVDVIDELPRYRALDPRWHDWSDVVAACHALALGLANL